MLTAAGALPLHCDGDPPFAELRMAERHFADAERQLQVGDRRVADLASVDPHLSPGRRVEIDMPPRIDADRLDLTGLDVDRLLRDV